MPLTEASYGPGMCPGNLKYRSIDNFSALGLAGQGCLAAVRRWGKPGWFKFGCWGWAALDKVVESISGGERTTIISFMFY